MALIDELLEKITECGIGGVTTASFAPAVTNTIYPRPKKKETTFRSKVNDLLDEFTQEELDLLYSDDDDDDSEKTYVTKQDWAKYNKEQQNINSAQLERKNKFIQKYELRNRMKQEELKNAVERFADDDTVSVVALYSVVEKIDKKIQQAIRDCNQYKNMPIDQFAQIKTLKMLPVKVDIPYWKIRKSSF